MSADLDKFDRAIDRAVREMLDVEPPADLRAKVIARIDAPGASAFRRKIWLAVPIAAAAVLVLALVLARRSEPPAQPVFIARGPDVVLPAPAPPPVAHAPAAHAEIARASAPRVSAASTDATDADAGPAIEPLRTIASIEVAPIAQKNIAPEPIGIAPLNPIPEVQVAPLNPPERRD